MADVEQYEREKSDLQNENDKLRGGHESLAVEKRAALDEMDRMRSQREEMEREAVEVRRCLEKAMPFFTQHFAR